MKEIFDDFLDRLTEDEIKETTCDAIAKILTIKFGFPVEVYFPDTGIEFWGFKNRGNDVEPVKIALEEIDKKVVRYVKNRARAALIHRVAEYDYQLAKRFIGKLIIGNVTRVDRRTKSVYAVVGGIHTPEWFGELPLREQPIHERGEYSLGQTVWFIVQNVKIVQEEDISRLHVVLTRRSPRLPEQLLQRTLDELMVDVTGMHIRCCKRVPGVVSILSVAKFAPPAAAEITKSELGEKVVVVLAEPHESANDVVMRIKNKKKTANQAANNRGVARHV